MGGGALPALATVLVALIVALWVWQRESWYLAIDQFGYLSFARDLAAGRIFHDWAPAELVSSAVAKGLRVDVLAQTYVLEGGRLYCRYAPGFPLVLAAALRLGGTVGIHLVNPLAMAALILVVALLATRLLRSAWLGLTAALLLVLLPNYLLLWSITPLRDVPAHATALLGLLLLVPAGGRVALALSVKRVLGAGLLLGYAAAIRPDAVLYGLPAMGLALCWRPWRLVPLLAGVLGCVVGASPMLAYNALVSGNPLRPTQAMEAGELLSSAGVGTDHVGPPGALAAMAEAGDSMLARSLVPRLREVLPALRPRGRSPESAGGPLPQLREILAAFVPDAAWAAAPAERQTALVQGGGLRLRHFASVLPVNLNSIAEVAGRLGLLLALIGALAALAHPPLALLILPYVLLTVPFFSLWSRPDLRYLAGSLILLPLLMVEGGRWMANSAGWVRQRLGASAAATWVFLLGGAASWLVWAEPPGPGARLFTSWTLAGAMALAAARTAWRPAARGDAFGVLCGLALFAIFGWRTAEGIGTRGSFQGAEVERARATVAGLLPDNALVLTTTRIGRPVENLEFYAGVNAIYLEEALRWGASPGQFAARVLEHGFRLFLLVPPEEAESWLRNPWVMPWFAGQRRSTIPPGRAREVFVASRHLPRGVPLVLVEVLRRPKPLVEERRRPLTRRESLPGAPALAGE